MINEVFNNSSSGVGFIRAPGDVVCAEVSKKNKVVALELFNQIGEFEKVDILISG